MLVHVVHRDIDGIVDYFDVEVAVPTVVAPGARHIVRVDFESSIDPVRFLQGRPHVIVTGTEASIRDIELVTHDEFP